MKQHRLRTGVTCSISFSIHGTDSQERSLFECRDLSIRVFQWLADTTLEKSNVFVKHPFTCASFITSLSELIPTLDGSLNAGVRIPGGCIGRVVGFWCAE
jgi:hypothetical protein